MSNRTSNLTGEHQLHRLSASNCAAVHLYAVPLTLHNTMSAATPLLHSCCLAVLLAAVYVPHICSASAIGPASVSTSNGLRSCTLATVCGQLSVNQKYLNPPLTEAPSAGAQPAQRGGRRSGSGRVTHTDNSKRRGRCTPAHSSRPQLHASMSAMLFHLCADCKRIRPSCWPPPHSPPASALNFCHDSLGNTP